MHVGSLTSLTYLLVISYFGISRGREKCYNSDFFGIHAHTTSFKLLPLKAVFRVQLGETS